MRLDWSSDECWQKLLHTLGSATKPCEVHPTLASIHVWEIQWMLSSRATRSVDMLNVASHCTQCWTEHRRAVSRRGMSRLPYEINVCSNVALAITPPPSVYATLWADEEPAVAWSVAQIWADVRTSRFWSTLHCRTHLPFCRVSIRGLLSIVCAHQVLSSPHLFRE